MAAQQPTLFEGLPILANVVRLFIIFTGFTLALVALKISLRAFYYADWERGFGTLAFALIAVTPAINGLYRFNESLLAVSTSVYLVGLLAGIVATYFRVTLRWRWYQRWQERRRDRKRARAGR